MFQGNTGADRRVAFLGDAADGFTLRGVRPGDYITGAIGVVADVGATTLFVRGDSASGGLQQVGSVRGGVSLRF